MSDGIFIMNFIEKLYNEKVKMYYLLIFTVVAMRGRHDKAENIIKISNDLK